MYLLQKVYLLICHKDDLFHFHLILKFVYNLFFYSFFNLVNSIEHLNYV